MFADHITQFFDGVVPAYKYYVELSKKNDNKKFMLMNAAIQAANMLFHYREKLTPLFPPKKFQVHDVAALCTDYHLIGRVFDMSKHNVLRNPWPLVNDYTAIEETVVQTLFPYKRNGMYSREHYGVIQTRIMINLVSGDTRDLMEICTNVVNFWAGFLVKNEFATKEVRFRYEGDDFLTEEQAKVIGNSAPMYVKEIGGGGYIMIGRMYCPLLKKFLRLPFSPADGSMMSTPVEERNYPGAKLKIVWNFPDMEPVSD